MWDGLINPIAQVKIFTWKGMSVSKIDPSYAEEIVLKEKMHSLSLLSYLLTYFLTY